MQNVKNVGMIKLIFGLFKQEQETKQKQNSLNVLNAIILGENIGSSFR
jgi:hypothetical protein